MNRQGRLIETSRMPRPLLIALAAGLLTLTALLLTMLASYVAPNIGAAASGANLALQTSGDEIQAPKGQTGAAAPMDCGLVWRVVPSPNGSALQNFLQKIKVVSANDIWAVGNYYETVGADQRARAMAQHWDGSTWSIVSVPQPGTQSYMNGISGTSATDIWAVGWYVESGSTHTKTFTIHWDGTTWSQIPSTTIGTQDNFLVAVAAVAPDAVWAVGEQGNQSLVLFWDGTTWASINSPDPDPVTFMYDVAALTADDMWAVGLYGGESGSLERTFTFHCSRAGCTTVTSPNGGVGSNGLEGVAALSPTDVYAVGYSTVTTDTLVRVPLTLHWDGLGWSVLPTPPAPPDTDDYAFHHLSVLSSGNLWAFGYAYNQVSAQSQTYAAHLDGSGWSDFTPPNQGAANILFGSDIVGPDDVWAVGYYSNGSYARTLIERYSDPCATPSPTITPSPQPTSVTCPIQFNDVPQGSAFYTYVRCLACRTILSGYPCGGVGEPCPGTYFRPGHNVTRGQAAKIISNAAGYDDNIPSSQQSFNDVPPTSAFWVYVERVHLHGAISGYPCGGVGEPCPGTYFRPGANLTRGQLAKIDTSVAGYTDPAPTTPTFADVPPTSTFYVYIERAHTHNIISGYACGGAGEPCPGTYFRPGLNVTRGQTAKIIGNTFFPNCQTP